jgi:hypothetical protein
MGAIEMQQRQNLADGIRNNLLAAKHNDLWDDPEPKFNYYRADGDCICSWCDRKYIEHPEERVSNGGSGGDTFFCFEYGYTLFVLCNTDRVKL